MEWRWRSWIKSHRCEHETWIMFAIIWLKYMTRMLYRLWAAGPYIRPVALLLPPPASPVGALERQVRQTAHPPRDLAGLPHHVQIILIVSLSTKPRCVITIIESFTSVDSAFFFLIKYILIYPPDWNNRSLIYLSKVPWIHKYPCLPKNFLQRPFTI